MTLKSHLSILPGNTRIDNPIPRTIWEIGDRKIIANSWTRQFWQLLYVQMSGDSRTFTKTDGTTRSCGPDHDNFYCAGVDNGGIIIGSSNQPVDVSNDYALVSPYDTSTFFYSGHKVSLGGGYLEFYRSFQNISGVSKDIYEVGLYCCVYDRNTFCCVERTVLDTPVTVAPDEDVPVRLKVYYYGGA